MTLFILSTLKHLKMKMSEETLDVRAQQLYALIALHPHKDELLCIMEEQLADELNLTYLEL